MPVAEIGKPVGRRNHYHRDIRGWIARACLNLDWEGLCAGMLDDGILWMVILEGWLVEVLLCVKAIESKLLW